MNIRWVRNFILLCCVVFLSSASSTPESPGLQDRTKVSVIEQASHKTATQAGTWRVPVGQKLHILRLFALPNGQYRAGHRGIDLSAGAETHIRAPINATVSFVGVVVDRPVLSLSLDKAVTISFEPVTTHLALGDQVTRGQVIGMLADEPHCRVPCVHMGVRINNEYQNPLKFLVAKPVLLPAND